VSPRATDQQSSHPVKSELIPSTGRGSANRWMILRILEHPLQCPDADAEDLCCGVLIAMGLAQHTVDVVALQLCERRPDVPAGAGGRKRLSAATRLGTCLALDAWS
jgi:hypothetical protein